MPQFNPDEVKMWFSNFGMNPSAEEVAQFTGVDYIGGGTAIANYVQTKKAQMEREANDPLKKVMEAQQTFTAAQEARANGLEKEANDLFGSLMTKIGEAPKLFGELTPDQIKTYMDPIKAQVEGDAARRGLGGSSTELNALTGSALNAGLDVGMKLKGAQADAIQGEIARKTGLLSGAIGAQATGLGLEANTAGALSANKVNDDALMNSLPLYLRSYAANEVANWRAAQKPKKGILGVMSDISQGMDLGQNILSLGMRNTLMGNPSPGAGTPSYSFAPQGGGGGSKVPLFAGNMGSSAGMADAASLALI